MNITLIGMAAVGKSVVGKELAKRLDYKLIEIDDVIEEKTKLKLQQIIDRFGDERLLEIEEKTILEFGKIDDCIISPGGSIIYSEKVMDYLKNNSVIIFLYAPLESIKKRLKNKDTRGIVGLNKKDLETLFDERQSLYKKYADVVVEVPGDFDVAIIAEDIIKKLKSSPYDLVV